MPLLYELLVRLTKSELRELKKWVRSPYVTHRTDIASLFNVLVTYCYRKLPLPPKEDVFFLVFPGIAYDDQRLRSLMSDLHLMIEQYLLRQALLADEVAGRLALAAFYRQRNLTKHYQRTLKKAAKGQAKDTLRNVDYLQNQLDFQIETSRFQSTRQRTGQLNFQEIGDTMDVLYLARKLKHVCSQLSHRAVYQTDYDFGLLPGWIDRVEKGAYLEVPAVALYYYCYRFLTEPHSQAYFRKFRDQLHRHQALFSQEELKDLYRAAINFCVRQLNEGSMDFAREGWELYQEGLSTGIFMDNQRLSRFTFDNVVGFGLRLEEFSPVADFITAYQIHLDPTHREATVQFNLARLEYGRKDYDRALDHLQAVNFTDLVNQLIAKTIQLKIYYELDAFDLLESHLDNFRLFIRRREVSDYHRRNFSNIIHYTRKLIALVPEAGERERLRKLIEAEQVLSEREWLLDKLSFN